jgi:hypothetical protein
MVPTGGDEARNTLDMLTPWDVGLPLIRLGSDGDGGYLVPNDLEGVSALLSPGVSETWTFERDIGERFDIPSFMIDGSVSAPPGLTSLQTFQKRWLATRSGKDRTTLADWVADVDPDPARDLMLQMDIEGAEWSIMKRAPRAILKRFRVIVIEFHGLPWMAIRPALRRRYLPVLQRLSQDFEVVHVHANNCCEAEIVGGVVVPRAIEVTYLRRDRIKVMPRRTALPHPLDRDCVPYLPPLELAATWPR